MAPDDIARGRALLIPTLDSVRVRLALWHTATVASLLVLVAAASCGYLERASAHGTDRYLTETANTLAAELFAEHDTSETSDVIVTETVREFRFRNLVTAAYRTDGELVAGSGDVAGDLAGERGGHRSDLRFDAVRFGAELARRSPTEAVYLTAGDAADGYRVYALPTRVAGHGYVVIVAQSLHDQAEMLRQVRRAYAIAIPLFLVLAGVGGYLLARRSLRPVVIMSTQAARIGANSLAERLAVANPRDELGQLAAVFNGLLERLDRAFDQQRRFMADASHELRTPVAIIRSEADVALSQPARTAADYRESLAAIRAEGCRLSTIVDDLLLLARGAAGQQPLCRHEVYLDELALECVKAMRTLAQARKITLACNADIDGEYAGDEELLRRLLMNLLDNAIKYSPAGAGVRITLDRVPDAYRITVVDDGPGIPPDAHERVFERFYRVGSRGDRGQGAESGGAGLGLAIARWVAEAHGGALVVLHSSASGTAFRATLPWHRGAVVT